MKLNPSLLAVMALPFSLSQAKIQSDQILFRAIQRTKQIEAPGRIHEAFLIRVRSGLKKVVFHIEDRDASAEICKQQRGMWAFVTVSKPGEINICNTLLSKPVTTIAHSLIHEVVHTLGYNDECFATEVEITAMKRARQRGLTPTSHWRTCGFR